MRRSGVRIPSRPPDFKRTYIIFENPVLLVSRTVTNPSQIVESIANALRINGIKRYPSFFTGDIF